MNASMESTMILPIPARHPLTRLVGLALLAAALGASAPRAAAQELPTEAYRRVATWTSVSDAKASGRFRGPDRSLGVVHVLDGSGRGLALWGSDGSLGTPSDLSVAGGLLYVADPEGDKIHRVDTASGQLLGSWSVGGRPSSLAWDPLQGRLYVSRPGARDVLVLDAGGVELGRWTAENTAVRDPRGIAVGPDGRIYLCDLGDGQGANVRMHDADGLLLGALPVDLDGTTQAPLDVAVDDDGDVYIVTDLALARYHGTDLVAPPDRIPGGRGVGVGPGSGLVMSVQDFRLGFTGVVSFADRRLAVLQPRRWGGPFAPLGTIEGPRRISGNAQNRFFFLDRWPRVQGYDPDGQPQSQFAVGGLHDLAAGGRGSAFTIDGRLLRYYAEDGNLLWEWLPPGADPSQGNPYSWLTVVDSFDLAGIGNAVLLFDMGDQRLYVVDFSGNPVAEWAISAPDGFTSVVDAALAEDRVYLINRSSGRLEARRLADGALRDSWVPPGSPSRIDVGQDGSIFVLLREGWVLKYAPDKRLLAAWAVDDVPERAERATDLGVGPRGRVAVSIEGVGGDDHGQVTVFEPDPSGAPPKLPVFADRCRLAPDKTAAPTQVELGQSVEITLSISGECPLADGRSDIMLVVDTSGSMAGAKMGAARTAALEFVGQLDYSRNQVGLITFASEAALVQPLTNNPRQLLRAIPDLGDDGGTNMLAAMQMADAEIFGERGRRDARKVIILLTDGRPNNGAGELLAMAATYRASASVDVYAVGLGLDVDSFFLKGMVTAAPYYFEAPSEYELTRIYDVIARRVRSSLLMEEVTVTDILPADMAFRPNSAQPPATYDPASRTLRWQLTNIAPGGMVLRYRVGPQQPGHRPTNVRAEATYRDGLAKTGQLVFPVPEVDVTGRQVFRVFMPVLMKQKCPEARTDAILVIDTSSSMKETPAGGTMTKLDAAIRAGRVFVDQLKLPEDRVALVAFNSEATLVQELSGDRFALAGAFGRLPSGTGTRIDLGLAKALEALGRRDPGHIPTILLLTDGRQADNNVAAVLAQADAAAAAGVTLFTIALGDDADHELLRVVAGRDSRFFSAPSEQTLAEIYTSIARSIPCQ
jgi:Mg-chelatase subunit ChlD/DNA-binding beta-propeller fold protein YncE